jgi:hypothetical protein
LRKRQQRIASEATLNAQSCECSARANKKRGISKMWVTALNVGMLLLMLAVLGYVANAARKIEAKLDSLIHDQGERLRRIQRDLERMQDALAAVGRV